MKARAVVTRVILAALLVLRTGVALGQSTATAAGRIQGVVTLSRQLSVRKPSLRVYAEYGIGATPPAAPADTNELQNVVVYLDSAPAPDAPLPAPSDLAIAQFHESFQPHVLPVLLGWSVAFPNRDPIFHNVFSLSRVKTFDLGRYPQNASKSVRFDRPGIVQVFCHIHSDMSAVVLVLSNPYFTVPAATGRYAIGGVPPGDYRIAAWHERTHLSVRRVHVVPGETAVVDFDIPLPPSESRP